MDFTTYTPTAGLTTAERTRAGYYGAIKAWAAAQEDILQYYTVTADDANYKLTFTPTAANLVNYPLYIEISSSSVYIKAVYSGTNEKSASYSHNEFKKDMSFKIYNNGGNLIFTCGSEFVAALVTGKSFGGGTAPYTMLTKCGAASYGSTPNSIATSGSAARELSNNINRNCDGISETYLVSRLAIPATDIITDKVYTLEGGMSLPSGIFKIGGKRYFTVFLNVIFEME